MSACPPIPDEFTLLRISDVVRATRLSRSKLYQMMSSGQLKFVKFGTSRRIAVSEIRKLIATATSK